MPDCAQYYSRAADNKKATLESGLVARFCWWAVLGSNQ